jgi:hypothetical protein
MRHADGVTDALQRIGCREQVLAGQQSLVGAVQ